MQNTYDIPNQQWFSGDYSQNNYYPPHLQQQAQDNTHKWFMPAPTLQTETNNTDDFENEPPLLEELGVNFNYIQQKTLAVLNPFGIITKDIIIDQDLAGPLVFCLLFGTSLLLQGKVHFGHIYGIGLMGCIGMYSLLNLMASEEKTISFTCTASVLGYCLLPMGLLSLIAVVFSLQGIFGYLIASTAILWCTFSSSKLFTIALSMEGQRLLVAYPCMLLYAVFALLAIF